MIRLQLIVRFLSEDHKMPSMHVIQICAQRTTKAGGTKVGNFRSHGKRSTFETVELLTPKASCNLIELTLPITAIWL
jgi:hypothetical protein